MAASRRLAGIPQGTYPSGSTGASDEPPRFASGHPWRYSVHPHIQPEKTALGGQFCPEAHPYANADWPDQPGWPALGGLPLTSGPLAFFVALNQGVSFASATAMGTLTGTISQAAFCVAYSRLALRFGWQATLLLSTAVFGVCTLLLQSLELPLLWLYLVGLFGFASFFLVLSGLLPQAGIAGAFVAAIAAILAIQAAALRLLRRRPVSAGLNWR